MEPARGRAEGGPVEPGRPSAAAEEPPGRGSAPQGLDDRDYSRRGMGARTMSEIELTTAPSAQNGTHWGQQVIRTPKCTWDSLCTCFLY